MKSITKLVFVAALAVTLANCSKCGGFLDLGLGKPAACGQKASPAS